MIIRIGIVAGDIWHLLDDKGPLTLTTIASSLEHPKDIVLMSVGWLAREGHVILEKEGNDLKVILGKES